MNTVPKLVGVLITIAAIRYAGAQTSPFRLPLQFKATEVIDFVTHASLDQVQTDVVLAAHARYVERWNQDFRDVQGQFNELRRLYRGVLKWTEAGAQDQQAVLIQQELAKLTAEWRPRMKALDDAFWDEISSILGEHQRSALVRGRLAHARLELRMGPQAVREQHIDLIDLLKPYRSLDRVEKNPTNANPDDQGHHLVAMHLTAGENQIVTVILDDYEPERVQRLRALVDAEERAAMLQAEAYDAARLSRNPSLDVQASNVLSNRANVLQGEGAKFVMPPSQRLVDLNRATLKRIVEALPPAKGRVVQFAYYESSYPEAYPDEGWAGKLYDAVEAFDDLAPEQRGALAAMRAAFQGEHDKLSERIMELAYERGLAQRGRGVNYEIAVFEAWDKQSEIGRKREALNLAQATKIRGMLLPEQAARMPEWDFEKNPPKRPWLRR